MQPLLISLLIFLCLLGAALFGMKMRSFLPVDHLTSDGRDSVKLSIGMVATMTAMLLGLLVASAKSAYDTDRTEVSQLAAKVTFMDRILVMYGPETEIVRKQLRQNMADSIARMWPAETSHAALELAPDKNSGNLFYTEIVQLSPQSDIQRNLKTQALSLSMDIAQLRTLLQAQAGSAILKPLLIILVVWLMVMVFGFGLLAPPNSTTRLSFLCSSFCLAGAIFMILELDHPFTGFIRVPSDPMSYALKNLE